MPHIIWRLACPKKKTASPYISLSSYYQTPLLGLWPHRHFFSPKNPTPKISATPQNHPDVMIFSSPHRFRWVSAVYQLFKYLLRGISSGHMASFETTWNFFFWILELKNSHVRRDRKIGTNLKQDFKWSSIGCLWWMKSSLEGYKHYRIFTNWHSKNV